MFTNISLLAMAAALAVQTTCQPKHAKPEIIRPPAITVEATTVLKAWTFHTGTIEFTLGAADESGA